MIEGSVAKIPAKTIICRLFNRFYGNHYSIFSILVANFSQLKLPLPRYGRKGLFAGIKTGFTAFAVLFLVIWNLFLVNLLYRSQETSEKVHSLALKPV